MQNKQAISFGTRICLLACFFILDIVVNLLKILMLKRV